jgi:hypothetical protein
MSLLNKTIMDTYQIELLDPKAKALLDSLVDLKLIKFRKSDNIKTSFTKLLAKIRNKSDSPISLEAVTLEVEAVRAKRYTDEQN